MWHRVLVVVPHHTLPRQSCSKRNVGLDKPSLTRCQRKNERVVARQRHYSKTSATSLASMYRTGELIDFQDLFLALNESKMLYFLKQSMY